MGSENRLSCPRCQQCPCKDGRNFSEVINLKGIKIYKHQSSIDVTIVGSDAGSSISYILHNTRGSAIQSADIQSPLEEAYISCPRCRVILQHAQKLLTRIPSIGKNVVIGICDHCKIQQSLIKTCKKCARVIREFLDSREVDYASKEKMILPWLSTIQKTLQSELGKTAAPATSNESRISRGELKDMTHKMHFKQIRGFDPAEALRDGRIKLSCPPCESRSMEPMIDLNKSPLMDFDFLKRNLEKCKPDFAEFVSQHKVTIQEPKACQIREREKRPPMYHSEESLVSVATAKPPYDEKKHIKSELPAPRRSSLKKCGKLNLLLGARAYHSEEYLSESRNAFQYIFPGDQQNIEPEVHISSSELIKSTLERFEEMKIQREERDLEELLAIKKTLPNKEEKKVKQKKAKDKWETSTDEEKSILERKGSLAEDYMSNFEVPPKSDDDRQSYMSAKGDRLNKNFNNLHKDNKEAKEANKYNLHKDNKEAKEGNLERPFKDEKIRRIEKSSKDPGDSSNENDEKDGKGEKKDKVHRYIKEAKEGNKDNLHKDNKQAKEANKYNLHKDNREAKEGNLERPFKDEKIRRIEKLSKDGKGVARGKEGQERFRDMVGKKNKNEISGTLVKGNKDETKPGGKDGTGGKSGNFGKDGSGIVEKKVKDDTSGKKERGDKAGASETVSKGDKDVSNKAAGKAGKEGTNKIVTKVNKDGTNGVLAKGDKGENNKTEAKEGKDETNGAVAKDHKEGINGMKAKSIKDETKVGKGDVEERKSKKNKDATDKQAMEISNILPKRKQKLSTEQTVEKDGEGLEAFLKSKSENEELANKENPGSPGTNTHIQKKTHDKDKASKKSKDDSTKNKLTDKEAKEIIALRRKEELVKKLKEYDDVKGVPLLRIVTTNDDKADENENFVKLTKSQELLVAKRQREDLALMKQLEDRRKAKQNQILIAVASPTSGLGKRERKQSPSATQIIQVEHEEDENESEDVNEAYLDNYNSDRYKPAEIIVDTNIYKYTKELETHLAAEEVTSVLFKIEERDDTPKELPTDLSAAKKSKPKVQDGGHRKGVISYALSDRTFIDKGWTMLPTEKVVRKMNIYSMSPAQPQFDWFERNKSKGTMYYDNGDRLAEFEDNKTARWYYRNGRPALEYYEAEELNAGQRIVVYSSGEPDDKGRNYPITILATFDYLGNGIVFDHTGKIRMKYNQTEGVMLDRTLGPVTKWKWHSLNDPPVLQQVMIDNELPIKDETIMQLGEPSEDHIRPDNEQMLVIEYDNYVKEKNKKMSRKFKPFQIKMKALKMNENFSLRVLDQANVYLHFRDGTTSMKLNLGMKVNNKEIVDSDTVEVGYVANPMQKLPAKSESLARMQHSLSQNQQTERARVEHECMIRPVMPVASIDRMHSAVSRKLRSPFPQGSSARTEVSTDSEGNLQYNYRKPCVCNVFYANQLI